MAFILLKIIAAYLRPGDVMLIGSREIHRPVVEDGKPYGERPPAGTERRSKPAARQT